MTARTSAWIYRHNAGRGWPGAAAWPSALVLIAAGCGSAATPPRPAIPVVAGTTTNPWDVSTMPDPCRLLTAAQVRSVLGSGAQPGRRLQSWPPLCQYGLSSAGSTYVYLSDDSRSSATGDFAVDRAGTARTVTVHGLGDDAYWIPARTTLHVLRAGTHLVVLFRGQAVPADAPALARRLAEFALLATG